MFKFQQMQLSFLHSTSYKLKKNRFHVLVLVFQESWHSSTDVRVASETSLRMLHSLWTIQLFPFPEKDWSICRGKHVNICHFWLDSTARQNFTNIFFASPSFWKLKFWVSKRIINYLLWMLRNLSNIKKKSKC